MAVSAADEPGAWHRVELPGASGPSRLNSVAAGSPGFVAVGTDSGLVGPAVWTSADGATWVRVDDVERPDDAAMTDLVPASPGFVAIGRVADDAAVWVADHEAQAWRRVLDADFIGARMNAIEGSWAGTIAVGHDPDTGSAAIWRRDLDVWSRIPESPDLEGINLLGVETGSVALLAVGEDVRDGSGAALISEDGITWRRVDAAEIAGARFNDAFWGGNGFTIVGARTGAESTPTTYGAGSSGEDWQVNGITDAASSELTAIAFSGVGLVAVGFGPTTSHGVVFENDFGAVWVHRQDPTDIFANGGLADVELGGDASNIQVAVGWTGSGAGDGPDARAAVWTTSAGPERRSFTEALPTPFDISTDPVVIATGVAVAAGTALLIPFPGALFNSTLEANGAEIGGWFAGLRARVGRLVSRVRRRPPRDFWQRPIGIVAFLLLSAVLYALLDPTLGVDLRSLLLVAGLLIGLVATTAIFAVPTAAFHWVRARELGRVRVLPATILIGVACVVLTRATGFQPGYLYGLLIGFTFAQELSVRDEGRSTAIASVWVLALTVAAWFALAAVRGWPDADGPLTTIASTALTTVVVAGLEGLVFGLLPLRFLPGAAIYAWNRRAWAGLFVLGLFGFFHVLVNPQSGYLADTVRTPLLTVIVLFAGFGAVSVGLWAFFRFRRPRAEPAVTS